MIDLSGTEVASYVYDAWGNIKDTKGEPTIRELNPIRYRGYVYDTETSLYYLQSRYYDPFTGRFLNADVYCDTESGTPLSTNMFAYCENNAINNVDYSGNSPKSKNVISNSYSGSTKNGFKITSKININKKKYNIYSTLTKKGVLKFYFDRNPNYSTLFNMGRTRIVAEAIFKAIKSINKKYKKKYLKGRTIPGINSEISWHYRAYNLRIAVNHANPADLGSTDKKNSGYDSNAWIFEPKINWGDEKL
jgi:RHS repeat-associated protein